MTNCCRKQVRQQGEHWGRNQAMQQGIADMIKVSSAHRIICLTLMQQIEEITSMIFEYSHTHFDYSLSWAQLSDMLICYYKSCNLNNNSFINQAMVNLSFYLFLMYFISIVVFTLYVIINITVLPTHSLFSSMDNTQNKDQFFDESSHRMSRAASKISQPSHKQQINSLASERMMTKRASQFINKLRLKKEQFEGKLHRIKRAEAQKRQREDKKKQIQKQMQLQLQRKIRRMKAQANIQFYNRKKQLNSNMIKSRSISPNHRKLSDLSEEDTQLSSFKLPAINLHDLHQIREEDGGQIPEGIPTTRKIKITRKRTKTQNTRYEDIRDSHNASQSPSSQQIQLFRQKKAKRLHQHRQRLHSEEYSSGYNSEKKTYLMNRNRTDDVSQYLSNFSNVEQIKSLVQNSHKRQKSSNIKNFMKTKRAHGILSTKLLQGHSNDSPGHSNNSVEQQQD